MEQLTDRREASLPGGRGRRAAGGPRGTGWGPARGKRLIVPVVLAVAVGLGAGTVIMNGQEPPSTMLGAAASVDGGLVRINGIIPLEADGWRPPGQVQALDAPVQEGAHRVRVLIELTALEGDGLEFEAEDYRVEYFGSEGRDPLWISTAEETVGQGGTVRATMVFEIPDRAVEMVLDGPGTARLSLGTEHHSGA